jgi:hypothetical protein
VVFSAGSEPHVAVARHATIVRVDDNSQEELLRQFMERQIWPDVPAFASRRWAKEEEEAALGYGEHGEPV